MKESKKAVRGSGRVAFIARIEGIKKMVEEGHPLLSIYQTYENDLPFRYSQFVKYVNRYIKLEGMFEQKGKKQEPEKVKPEEKYKGKSTTEILNSPVNKEDII